MKMKKNTRSAAGFTLVEALVAVVVFILIGLLATYLLSSNARSVENVETAEAVTNAAEEALTHVTGIVGDLPQGGPFELDRENIQITGCTSQNCDIVLEPAVTDPQLLTSPAKGIPFSPKYEPPTGYTIKFYRMWRVDDVDTDYRLRELTVVIIDDLTKNEPLLVQKTKIAFSN
jgi:type II secretory pathway pseudopilin PulG